MAPGFYTVVIHIPGYADLTPAQFECKVGESCGPGNLTPSANPRFTGTLTLNPESPTSTPQIRVTPPGVGTVTVRYAAGVLHWQEPGAPEDTITPGLYTVSVTLAGYGPIVDQPFNCVSGASCRLDLAMIKPTNLTVIGTAAGGDPLGARYSLTIGGATPQLTAGATANRVTFAGLTSGPPATLTDRGGGIPDHHGRSEQSAGDLRAGPNRPETCPGRCDLHGHDETHRPGAAADQGRCRERIRPAGINLGHRRPDRHASRWRDALLGCDADWRCWPADRNQRPRGTQRG